MKSSFSVYYITSKVSFLLIGKYKDCWSSKTDLSKASRVLLTCPKIQKKIDWSFMASRERIKIMFKIKELLRNKKTDRVVTCVNIAVITIAFINAFVWQSLWLCLAVVIESILSCYFLRLCRRERIKREAAKEMIDKYFLESFEFIRDYVSIQKCIGKDTVSKLVTVKIKRNIDLFCFSLFENLISWEE